MKAGWEPLVSVVIPIYNAEQYLKQCIDSVTGQTYRNLEIILVDDGSTDSCPELCDAYAAVDRRVVVVHRENGGLVSARKAGVAVARGEYITFVDADDWIDLEAYEAILKRMAARNVDMILYGLVEEYGERSVEKENLPAEGYYGARKEIREKIYPRMLCQGTFFRFGILPNLVCKMARKELLKEIQPLVSDEVEFGEDADCTFRMLLRSERIQILRYAPYHYRKRQDSMVWRPTAICRVRGLYQDLKNAFGQCGERELLLPQLYRYILFILLLKATDSFVGCESFDRYFTGERMVLYGAGGFGQAIRRMLTSWRPDQDCLWVDQKYQEYQALGLPVSPPEMMAGYGYDSVFIAVLDTGVCGEIAGHLMEWGVSAEKIGYIKPDEKYLEWLPAVLEPQGAEKGYKGYE